MPRYIDADKLSEQMLNHYKALRAEYGDYDHYTTGYDDAIDTLESFPAADVVPKSEVDKARQDGYERGKREVVREIYQAFYNEIIEARNSNYEAIKERETKHNVNRYEDTFCYYCDGKIHALDGIFYFFNELVKKYMGE